MTFGVSDIARHLNIERDVVKKMAWHFKAYLKPEANPSSGGARKFSIDDFRVLCYVHHYWEDEPDFENIRIGLNSNDHFEYPFNEILCSVLPIFSDPPDVIEPLGSYVVFNEVRDGMELFHLAEAYKAGGDMLVRTAIKDNNGYEVIYPIIYNYRHATELYLKSFVGTLDHTHSLTRLYNKFKDLTQEKFRANPSEWFESIVKTLDEFDPEGTAFRYGTREDEPRYEVFVDLSVLRTKMNLLARAFQQMRP